MNYELPFLNKKIDSFSKYLKLFSSNLPSPQEKSLEENITVLKKNLCTRETRSDPMHSS